MSGLLQRLHELDNSFALELDKLLHNDEYVGRLLGLPEKELIQLVNYLSDTINRFTHIGAPSRKCLLVLRKICGARRVLPAAYDAPGTLSFSSKTSFAHGGSCETFKGTLNTEVCIKKIRISSKDNLDAIKELFCKEAVVWKHLDHPNVVALKGITLNPLQLVSEWMSGGELRDYIKQNPNANRINLLLGVAEGLAYLHSCSVVHGDLKGPNIVVDESGNAQITDLGLTSIIRDPHSVPSASDGHGYTPWWTAPEILLDGIPASKKSDIFSFGMIIYEAFSGKVPFHDVPAPAVPASIMCGKRPPRPSHPKLTDALWELAERCWTATARDRPEMEEVVKTLKEINTGKTAQVKKRPSTRRKLSDYVTPQKGSGDGGGDVAIPYDVEVPPPVPTPPPPPRAGGNERLTHEVMQAIVGGTTNEPPQRPPTSADNSDPLAVRSTAGVVAEREPLRKGGDTKGFKETDATGFKEKDVGGPKGKDIGGFKKDVGGFKGKDTGGLNEKPEERGRGDVGEHAVKKGKGENPPKPAENTTTAPAPTKVTHDPVPATREAPPETGNNNVAGSSGSVDNPNKPPTALSPGSSPDEDTTSTARPPANRHVDQPRNQTSKHSGVQPDQPPAPKPANNPRSRDKLAVQDQGQTTNTHAATLELPISVVTEKLDESNAPPQQESPTPLKPVPPKSEQLKPEPPMDKRNPSTPQPPEQGKSKKFLCC